MSSDSRQHGFTRVDRDFCPGAWVECLDRLHREPFFRSYKDRVRAILAPRRNGLYLEAGAGVGTDARAARARVIAIDTSLTMCRESHRRGHTECVVADAEALPLASALVDGCWADRTLQHVTDPNRSLAELVRVMKRGATLVVVDPDYGTQQIHFSDQRLAREVLDFRAHHAIQNGTLAHEMGDRLADGGLQHVSVEERVLTVRDPNSVDHVMGLRSWASAAAEAGMLTEHEVRRWETLYDQEVTAGTFVWSVSFFISSGRKA